MRSIQRSVRGAAAAACLSVLVVATGVQAQVVYLWEPDAGSGGSGRLVVDDAFLIANDNDANYNYDDAGNFYTEFSNPPIVEIDFTFDNGLNIGDVAGFSTASTIQTIFDQTQFQATGGVIDDWTFQYVGTATGPDLFIGATVPTPIFCITLPCPQPDAEITFGGLLDPEVNTGRWVLVPEPSAGLLLVAGIALLRRPRV